MNELELNWQYVDDTVMGGVSQGSVERDGEAVVLKGLVSLENQGGFIQAQALLPQQIDYRQFSGLWVECEGDGHEYVMSLKTSDLWMPWQSYRTSMNISERGVIYLPFEAFKPYRTASGLNVALLEKFAILAIGEARSVHLKIFNAGLY